MTFGVFITLIVVILAALAEVYIYIHSNGFHRKLSKYGFGSLNFWALGDRVLIEEDAFKSGYECSKCNGKGSIPCDNCGGTQERNGKKCSICDGTDGTLTCPSCGGKGGLIVVPDTSQRRPTSGTVVSVGAAVKVLKVGQSVLYSSFAGYTVDLKGATGQDVVLRILHESEILSGMEGHLTLTNLRGKSEIAQFQN